MERYTFKKSERLRHHSLVDALFEEGEHIHAFPLRLTYRRMDKQMLADNFRCEVPEGIGPVQLMITVPKKKLRHAVDRVAMRRRIREAWRLQRLPLKARLDEMDDMRTLSVAIVYLADKKIDSKKIHQKMALLLDELEKRLSSE